MGRRRRLNGDTKNGGGKDDCCVCPQIRHTRFPLGKIIIIERKGYEEEEGEYDY